jgi:HemY protein
MPRLVLFLLAILGLSFGFSWLADNPGTITVDWQGYHAEPTVFQVVVLTAVLTALGICAWTILRQIWTSPAAVSHFLTKRRQQRGLDALSSGMIAIGAGDRATATRYALQARKSLPNEPLTHLLRAQAAQLSGDRATSRRIFEAMLSAPDTEQLGLRGLYLEAAREGEGEAQRQFAERAVALNPKLEWPVEGLFELQCKDGDWSAAIETLNLARRHGTLDKTAVDRRRAVLLTGQAMALEDSQSDKALGLALEAHALAKDLIPAAAIAGRLLAARGNTAKAAKVLQKTWARAPHPDLAVAYAYARIGDSPRDRLDRVKQLAALNPHSNESAIAVANAAIEAQDFDQARDALSTLVDGRMTRRVATLMARIEKEQHGDKGRVRQWLARAVHAPRDPAWTADGVVSDTWAPASPVTGALDAFQWRVPVEEPDMAASVTGTSSSLDDLMQLDSVIASMPDVDTTIDAQAAEAPAPAEPEVRAPPKPSAAERPENTATATKTAAPPRNETPQPVRETVRVGPSVAAKRTPAHVEIKTVTAMPLPTSKTSDRGSRRLIIDDSEPAEYDMDLEAEPSDRTPVKNAAEPKAATRVSSQAPANPIPRPPYDARAATIVIKPAADVAGDRKAPAAPMAAKAAAGSANSGPNRRAESAVLVPLHAPDDPGPELEDETGAEPIRPWPYRLK